MGRAHAGLYRRAVTQTFIAERFALGFTEVVDFADILLRVALCYVGALQLRSADNSTGLHLSTAWAQHSTGIYPLLAQTAQQHWWWLTRSVVSIFACHAYGLVKGYQ